MLIQKTANDISEEGGITAEECDGVKGDNNFTSFTITDLNGYALNRPDVSDRDYFQQCRDSMELVVSVPIMGKNSDSMNVMIAAPLVKNRKFSGAAIAEMDAQFLSDIVAGTALAAKMGRSWTRREIQLVMQISR